MNRIKELVLDLTVLNKEKRFEQLCKVLKLNNLDFYIEEDKDNTRNIIIKLRNSSNSKSLKHIVLGAHYDIFPNSLGFNDNTIAVAMLIEFAKTYKGEVPINIVFFDKEESGMIGSDNYTSNYEHEIYFALIFDIIGFGDTLVVSSTDEVLKELLYTNFGIKALNFPLPSDNLVFSRKGIPTALITATNSTDLQKIPNKAHIHYVASSAKFYRTFHGRELDNDITILNFDLAEGLLDKLSTMFSIDHKKEK